ncbi:aminotransferase class IV [Clostridium chauvoei]|uniref:Aminotransferase class IV n=2 Tax=Clostridium chauvoei TaxID=46867 RepID=A0ABD4RIK8_9CLOT|nr:aminotransferase class IV [Clostridium chauvoei]ATD55473.1 4-amino-4-deoxychorismate lyase [Clostridium chauvoei]ATD56855.1 4-amino-4-deoxychorismate lyase [Clostridium chauvoei]MBX7280688.1 aminotransferase class IV [Clostridium chauvoei]MBX7283172.1 aminotransferase class IV [Clostridium chauvoei]MBX7285729.1 aminotransferase class IV [Clostridium chauvoei]
MREILHKHEKLSLDEGVFFGRGVFETILVKEKPIFFDEHIERLNQGIEVLEIGEKVDKSILKIEIDKLNLKNKALKVLVTPKNLILIDKEIPYSDEDYKKGFKLKLSKVIRNSTSPLTYIKSINYMDNLLENKKAKKEGYNEVIFINEDAFITEGSTSNIFIVKENNIYTPKIECGLLNGTIRKYILKNTNCIEKEFTIEELLNSDEVFITNSLLGIMRVISIEEKIFNKHSITDYIRRKYTKDVEMLGGE